MKQWLTALLLLTNSILHAQNTANDTTRKAPLTRFQLFSTDYFHFPYAQFHADNEQGKIKTQELRTSIQMAFPIKPKKTYLLNGIQHYMLDYDTKLKSDGSHTHKTYHSFQYSLGVIQTLPQKWLLVSNVSIRHASDYNESISNDDFVYQASLLTMKKAHQDLEYGAGLTYTSSIADFILIPFLSLTYRKNKWTTQALIPSYIAQYYKYNDRYRLGLKASFLGTLYNVNFENNLSSLDLNRISFSRVNIGPEVLIQLVGDLYFNAEVGVSAYNNIQFQNNELDNEYDITLQSKPYFNFGLKILK